jgi:hypothetical protein
MSCMFSIIFVMIKGAGQEGLLEYLEEIIGSSAYIPDIQLLQEDMKQKTETVKLCDHL